MGRKSLISTTVMLLAVLAVAGGRSAAQEPPAEDPITARINAEWNALDLEMQAALKHMVEISGAKKQIEILFQAMRGQVGKIIQQKEDELGKTDPRLRELLERHMSRMGDMMVDHFDEWMRPMMVAFSHHYTLDEIRELNAFYESPVGRKLIETNPKLVAEGMEGMMPIMMKHMDKVNQEMQEELKALLEEIEREKKDASD